MDKKELRDLITQEYDKKKTFKRTRKSCVLSVMKKVSDLMRTYDVTFDAIEDIAKDLNIDTVKNTQSLLFRKDYIKLEEVLLRKD